MQSSNANSKRICDSLELQFVALADLYNIFQSLWERSKTLDGISIVLMVLNLQTFSLSGVGMKRLEQKMCEIMVETQVCVPLSFSEIWSFSFLCLAGRVLGG